MTCSAGFGSLGAYFSGCKTLRMVASSKETSKCQGVGIPDHIGS